MMHSNGFVLAVKHSGQVLRELNGEVFLPFNSEYSLFLKNTNNVRSVCSVKIDGTDVLGGSELIVPANGSLDLERFLSSGDMESGNRFKFVPLSDPNVSDPTSSENGTIEVTFWKELSYTYTMVANSPIIYNCCYNSSHILCSSNSSLGATVVGSGSNQKFSTVEFGPKDYPPTVLRLYLRGRKEPLKVDDTKKVFCSQCGLKSNFSANFCSRCGFKLDKESVLNN